MNLIVESLAGKEIRPCIAELARLRMEIFRDFPYLYDGDMAYEEQYLASYLRSEDTVIVLVKDGDNIVGVSSAMPLEHETAEVTQAFLDKGIPLSEVFYLGESLLMPAYRGRGLGHVFFEMREAYARKLERFRYCTFFAVQRSDDHPMRPSGYKPLDGFWRKRGYVPRPDLRTFYSWKDVGEAAETKKPMMFWLKELR